MSAHPVGTTNGAFPSGRFQKIGWDGTVLQVLPGKMMFL